uniref:Reverse transcriptase zinc-binding domain-containing protein n=1 Tax=Oryza brachyantha TaxID=4533 RepID=J3MBJ6_ORYBR
MGIVSLLEFLRIYRLLSPIQLWQQPDSFQWRWSSSGLYSTRSAYNALFMGREIFQEAFLWKAAPNRCCYFCWLVAHQRCWTADRLSRRGLPRPPHCVLCDQAPETIDHILIGCPESRQLWWLILNAISLPRLTPMSQCSFGGWWGLQWDKIPRRQRKGFDMIVTLIAWSIWKERNAQVFNHQASAWSLVGSGEGCC